MRSLPLVVLLASACTARDDGARLKADVDRLVHDEGDVAHGGAAVDRVVADGRAALPHVETALHTADARGRKNLIVALRRIGDPDAIPLLRHVAEYDAATDVRQEAEWTLKKWAGDDDDRGRRARDALRSLDESRGREETGASRVPSPRLC